MGYLSLATMLVQTNDGIVLAANLCDTMDLISYDAGTEENNTAIVAVEAVVEMPPMEPEPVEFEVMLDNLTMGAPAQGGQIFSPPIFVTHGHGFSIGASGEAASAELTELATHVPGPPFGGMERAPTEGSVIAPHPGIAGTADVGAAFGWTEPTATVTVEAMVEMPPMEPEPVEFEVMLTNLTMGVPAQGGQIFSPPIFVTHGHGAASAELTALAETGNHAPLAALAMGSDAVGSVVAFPIFNRCIR
jgi:hypothetical protein